MFARFSHWVHAHFIWLLIGSYLLAAVFPGVGLAVRSMSWGRVSLPMAMLGFLLFNAGMGIELAALGGLKRDPWSLVLGLLANLFVPIAFIAAVSLIMRLWHNSDEVQNILVGLALVASMPIAGSSTAWSQNANGNLTLSLGLVLCSTFLSPLTTPVALNAVGLLTTGDYSEDLHELAGSDTGWFLTVSVIVPTILGIVSRLAMGAQRAKASKANLRLANSAILLFLNYANAAVSLPQAIRSPDYDFLAVSLAITLSLCIVAFGAGWAIARYRHCEKNDRVALMFGLGMNNNGAGLVLASMTMADHPNVLLPIILYNLVQHLVAGLVNHWMFNRADDLTAEQSPDHRTLPAAERPAV